MPIQSTINFPRKKKSSMLKKVSDKMGHILTKEKTFDKNSELHLNVDKIIENSPRTRRSTRNSIEEINTDNEDKLLSFTNNIRSTRSRSSSQILNHEEELINHKEPKTPKSKRSNEQNQNIKTPSILLNELTINTNETKTPSSLLKNLKINSDTPKIIHLDSIKKIDSPKRKRNSPLEFSSPKRLFNNDDQNNKIGAIDKTLLENGDENITNKNNKFVTSPRIKLFSEEIHENNKKETSKVNNEIKNNSVKSHSTQIGQNKKEYIKNISVIFDILNDDSPQKNSLFKRSQRLNSPMKLNNSLDLSDSPLKRSQKFTSSPVKTNNLSNTSDSPLKRSQKLISSPMKINNLSNTSDSPLKRSQRLNSPMKINNSPDLSNSPLKRSQKLMNSPMNINNLHTIENILLNSQIKSSKNIKTSSFNSPSKQNKNLFESPRRSIRFKDDSPKKINNKFNLDNENNNDKDSNNSQNSNKNYTSNGQNSKYPPDSTNSDPKNIQNSYSRKKSSKLLKGEEEYLRPISPIKNIILDDKSPFKSFIRDDDNPRNDLLRKSPRKKSLLSSPRKLLFQEEEIEKVEVSSPLPGREAQINEIRDFLLRHLNNESSGSLYISGPPGTGKSASLKVIIDQPEVKNEYKTIYINCNSVKNAASVYEHIVNELKLSTQGKSERYQLAAILKHFQTNHKSILLILDEIDALESRKQTILYTIFEWPSIKNSKLVLVGVANALDLTDRMLPRLQANVTLKPTLMNFAPYSKQQILDIITKKLKETDKFNMFNATALQLLAGKVAAVSGDIRKAIDITNHLIDLTYDNVKKNGEVSIGLKEVLNVISSVYCTSQSLNCSKDEDSFPLQQKLALASFLLLKTKPNMKEITLGKLHEVYRKVCSQRNLQPLDMSEFISACSLLDARGVMKIYGKTKNRISKVTLQWDEQDVKEAMRDKQLISTILNDFSCL